MNPLKGAKPLPGPIMMTGVPGLLGSRNCVAVSVVAEGDFPEVLDKTDLEPVELRQQTEPEVELDHDLRDLDGMRSVLFSISLYFSRFYKINIYKY